jgi:DNA-binding Xre family transcriptional regulator
MDDLDRYILQRKERDPDFADNYESGFEDFKLGFLLKAIRMEKGISQDELARNIHTTKSAISRLENHAEDIKLSTIERVAKALGKRVIIQLKEERAS